MIALVILEGFSSPERSSGMRWKDGRGSILPNMDHTR